MTDLAKIGRRNGELAKPRNHAMPADICARVASPRFLAAIRAARSCSHHCSHQAGCRRRGPRPARVFLKRLRLRRGFRLGGTSPTLPVRHLGSGKRASSAGSAVSFLTRVIASFYRSRKRDRIVAAAKSQCGNRRYRRQCSMAIVIEPWRREPNRAVLVTLK